MSVEPSNDWPRPPAGGYTADDLDQLPNLPPHTELIDGSLVFMSPQTLFHVWAIDLLAERLKDAAPVEWVIAREMTVRLGKRNRPEPDILVVRTEATEDLSVTSFRPEDVLLAVEVVSEDSVERDRDAKPRKYAAAGIPHFWRVEKDQGRPVVYVYERDPATADYAITGIYHEILKLNLPFPLSVDLTVRPGRRP